MLTDFTRVNHVYDVCHVLFFSDGFATKASDHILGIDTEQLGYGGRSRQMRIKLGGIVRQEHRVVGERITLIAEMVHEEAMEGLDEMRVIHIRRFSAVVDELDSI
jgi:hypothetical protein